MSLALNHADPKRSSNPAFNILNSFPALRAFLVYLLAFLLFFHYARHSFYRDPGSAFFDVSRAYERRYTAIRQAEADAFLEASETEPLDRDVVSQVYNVTEQSPVLCTSYITVDRDVPRQYIYNAVGSLLHGMTPSERASLHLSLLFANAQPEKHSAYNEKWFLDLLDDHYGYSTANLTDEQIDHLRDLEETADFEEKGVFDYTLALERCYANTQAPYIAVFEDDTIAAEGWFTRVVKGLKDAELLMQQKWTNKTEDSPQPEVSDQTEPNADKLQKRVSEGMYVPEAQESPSRAFESSEPNISAPPTARWLYLRLFNQERSTGFASKDIGGNHEYLISLGIVAGALCVLVPLRRVSPRIARHLTITTLAIICFLAIPSFVILFFQCGKASVLPPAPGVRAEDFGCCSQGLIFNRDEVPGLVSHLRMKKTGRCDLMTSDYARGEGIERLSMYPMVLQHVGTVTATSTTAKEAQAVWSMAFEDLSKDKLDADHRTMVNLIYGKDRELEVDAIDGYGRPLTNQGFLSKEASTEQAGPSVEDQHDARRASIETRSPLSTYRASIR
ncbi:MAG: hypothetical protein M1831_002647 [Alyxoria varia]|nr:MAG: hypothetical protein M1831_002647 [Alyxoria varia]